MCFTSWGPSFWQTWPHCGFPTLPQCYLWVVRLIGGGYCTRHHKRIDGHHSESCLPWKDLNCGLRGEKSLSPMATSSIVSGLLWKLFIGPVPLMKDAHQCRDVKKTLNVPPRWNPDSLSSCLSHALFSSPSLNMSFPATFTLSPLCLSLLSGPLWMISIGAAAR